MVDSPKHPKVDWDTTDLYQEFERFRCHVSFVFVGPLAALEPKEKAGWLGTWIAHYQKEAWQKDLITDHQ
ncbi:hypothetical protein ILYODFUR_031018 [Ilyodon furcidens]|uniref:Uncharacterized protein n=1 Tax=Ilyodon furcidens TaxID=33524 RepID=A0ABV0TFF5_9TELE